MIPLLWDTKHRNTLIHSIMIVIYVDNTDIIRFHVVSICRGHLEYGIANTNK